MNSFKTRDEYIAAISLLDFIEQFPTKVTTKEWIREKRLFAIKKLNDIQKEEIENN